MIGETVKYGLCGVSRIMYTVGLWINDVKLVLDDRWNERVREQVRHGLVDGLDPCSSARRQVAEGRYANNEDTGGTS